MALAVATIDPGLPKQKRSRARRAAMIEHGIELLKSRDLEDIPVAEITGALGYSTGSFYSAFEDKGAFFTAAQKEVNARLALQIEAEIETSAVTDMTPADRIALCIDFTLRLFRAYRGVIRSALRYEAKMPEAWAPNRASAQRITDGLCKGLRPADDARMRVAIQIAFGTMVNALLHDPGPLHLDDQKFATELKAALRPYLIHRED